MKRQGLSGNNSSQQQPSQAIWARTLWWMRWALSSQLPPRAPSVHPPNHCVGRRAASPFHLNPQHHAVGRVSGSFFPNNPQTHAPREWPITSHPHCPSSMRIDGVRKRVKSYHTKTVKAHQGIREIMALNRLGKDRDLRPWQIYGEDLCIVMRTGTESVSDDNTDLPWRLGRHLLFQTKIP